MDSINQFQIPNDTLLDTLVDAVLVIDGKGTVINTNKALNSVFGYDRKDVIGQNVKILMPEPDHSRHDDYLKNYEQTGNAKIIGVGREVKARKKTGEVFWVRLAVNMFFQNNERYYLGTITDISKEVEGREILKSYSESLEAEVQRQTAEIRHSQEIYTSIAKNFPNGTITVLDEKLEYVFVNGKGSSFTGPIHQSLIGTSFLKRLQPGIYDLVKSKLQDVLNGLSTSFEMEFGQKHFLINAVPLTKDATTGNRVLIIETDITPIKSAAMQIMDALKKERELGELKSRFVSVASHEFRTPLASILSSAELIQRYLKTENQDKSFEHSEKIKRNIRHLNLILNDFLSLEKLQTGIISHQPSHFSLLPFIQEIAEDLSILKQPQQNIQYEVYPPHLEVFLDRDLLRYAMVNLVSNALKYSGTKGLVEIKCFQNKNRMIISVIDNGFGIPIDEQDKLFNRFFRASNAINIQGTGLGLHIVKNYVELMGGTIDFESQPDLGTQFNIQFEILNTINPNEKNTAH